jgi:hypothetical protein
MRFYRKRFVRVFLILLVLDAVAFSLVMMPRRPLTAAEWARMDSRRLAQRNGEGMFFTLCSDCLGFAIARRPLGGWEGTSASLFQIANFPAFVPAWYVFASRQRQPGGTSKGNSDLATALFALCALLQWAAIAAVTSIQVADWRTRAA